MNAEWSEWRDNLASQCYGRWEQIAPAICNDERIETIQRANVTCPECGRSQKLYIRDKHTYAAHCCSASCNAHYYDGVALIAELNNERVTDTLKRIEDYLGLRPSCKSNIVKMPVRKKPVPKPVVDKTPKERVVKEKSFLLKTLQNSKGSLVEQYLSSRGINVDSLPNDVFDALSFHPKLRYYAKVVKNDIIVGEERGEYPAMVAKIFNSQRTLIGFHKTYLDESGKKQQVLKPKQLSEKAFEGAYSEYGAYVPLSKPHFGRYGIAEGIETANAVIAMKRPCWSVISATGIKNFVIPDDCKELDLYGDLDASGTGQTVIMQKYYDVLGSHPNVKVNLYLPPESMWNKVTKPKGIDFLDVYRLEPNILPPIYKE